MLVLIIKFLDEAVPINVVFIPKMCLFFIFWQLFLFVNSKETFHFFVDSMHGNDLASGSQWNDAFRSLRGAFEAARNRSAELIESDNIFIHLNGTFEDAQNDCFVNLTQPLGDVSIGVGLSGANVAANVEQSATIRCRSHPSSETTPQSAVMVLSMMRSLLLRRIEFADSLVHCRASELDNNEVGAEITNWSKYRVCAGKLSYSLQTTATT